MSNARCSRLRHRNEERVGDKPPLVKGLMNMNKRQPTIFEQVSRTLSAGMPASQYERETYGMPAEDIEASYAAAMKNMYGEAGIAYTLEGDESGQIRHTRSGKWLEDLEEMKADEQDSSEHDYRPDCMCSQCLAIYTAHLDAGSIDGFALYDEGHVPPMPPELVWLWTPRSEQTWTEPEVQAPIHDFDDEYEAPSPGEDASDADVLAMLEEMLNREVQ